MRAFVLFEDSDRWWLRVLRPGFRHCAVVLQLGEDAWLAVEPLAGRTKVSHWRDLPRPSDPGALWVPAAVRDDPPAGMMPVRPYTCVEEVKRILGIRAPWVLTPWQLYRHLTGENAHAA